MHGFFGAFSSYLLLLYFYYNLREVFLGQECPHLDVYVLQIMKYALHHLVWQQLSPFLYF